MSEKISRREFLRATGAAVALAALGGYVEAGKKPTAGKPRFSPPKGMDNKLVVASGKDVEAKIADALKKLGGIEKFVKKGDRVVLKPNVAWAREPGQGATTNPAVVGAVAAFCRKAGAREVIVLEHTIDRPAVLTIAMSGIADATKKAGARVVSASGERMYREIAIPKGRILSEEQVARDVLDADVFINLPVAKVHSQTSLSLGMKNLMGIIWDRGAWHASESLDQCIADFATAVRPTLIILDATTMLMTKGPKGPGETRRADKIIIGVDPVAVDSFGATLFDLDPRKVEHIALAYKAGAGEINLDGLKILKV